MKILAISLIAASAIETFLVSIAKTVSIVIYNYCSAELQELKNDSIQAHLAWEAVGKPRQGLLNNLRLQAKAKYKTAIKNAAFLFENDADDDLSNLYLRKDLVWRGVEFWPLTCFVAFKTLSHYRASV